MNSQIVLTKDELAATPSASNIVGNRGRTITLLVFLTLLNILNFADRFLIQGFAVDMIRDLHLSNLEFTLLTGFVFTTFYTVMGLFMGALADRVHRPRLIAFGIFSWSALTAATGFANNFMQLGLVRMFTGVGEAVLTPAALGILGDRFKQHQRAFAAGFYYLGAPIGIGAAFIIAGTLGTVVGWRNCFFILGAIGVVLTGFLFLLREPRNEQQIQHAASKRPVTAVFAEIRLALRASPALCLLILGGVLVIFAQGAFVLDQVWLVQEKHLGRQHAQQLAGIMFIAGGVLGSLLGGYLADLLQAHRAGGRLWFLALIYLLGVPVGYIYRLLDTTGMAFYICMFIGRMMITIGYGPLFACLQDLVPVQLSSTMTAFMILCMTLFGTSLGNLAVGVLADVFRTAGYDTPITLAVMVGMAPWLLAIPCFVMAARMMETSVAKSFAGDVAV
ncbi:MFS transporter [Undibacterium pigrum]|uniref:Sugar phosphate permease n=1 Tax=Undibacterium pigrum TaxID=401470 RepID=A0A318IQW0_9BURK|nr:MFS transporter [Undibacterium pigrum]PXX37889.1 sugar phosphate permease [Undibacterium pigrum]